MRDPRGIRRAGDLWRVYFFSMVLIGAALVFEHLPARLENPDAINKAFFRRTPR